MFENKTEKKEKRWTRKNESFFFYRKLGVCHWRGDKSCEKRLYNVPSPSIIHGCKCLKKAFWLMLFHQSGMILFQISEGATGMSRKLVYNEIELILIRG